MCLSPGSASGPLHLLSAAYVPLPPCFSFRPAPWRSSPDLPGQVPCPHVCLSPGLSGTSPQGRGCGLFTTMFSGLETTVGVGVKSSGGEERITSLSREVHGAHTASPSGTANAPTFSLHQSSHQAA